MKNRSAQGMPGREKIEDRFPPFTSSHSSLPALPLPILFSLPQGASAEEKELELTSFLSLGQYL